MAELGRTEVEECAEGEVFEPMRKLGRGAPCERAGALAADARSGSAPALPRIAGVVGDVPARSLELDGGGGERASGRPAAGRARGEGRIREFPDQLEPAAAGTGTRRAATVSTSVDRQYIALGGPAVKRAAAQCTSAQCGPAGRRPRAGRRARGRPPSPALTSSRASSASRLGDLEEQLVVDLQDHARAQPALARARGGGRSSPS